MKEAYINVHGGPEVTEILGKHLSLIGSTMGTIADFASVMPLIFDGKLKVHIDSTFPLAAARTAQEKLESGDFFGKVLPHVSAHVSARVSDDF